MHIVRIGMIFRQGSYCRMSVKPEEVGITNPDDIVKFELTQRYASLLWLPVFPLSVEWQGRTKTGYLTRIDYGMEMALSQVRYSWISGLLACFVPLAIAAAIGYYFLSSHYERERSNSFDVIRKDLQYEQNVNAINSPVLEDCYIFYGADMDQDLYAKVTAFNDTAIQLVAAAEPEHYVSDKVGVLVLLERENEGKHFPAEWVSKDKLKEMARFKHCVPMNAFTGRSYYIGRLQR